MLIKRSEAAVKGKAMHPESGKTNVFVNLNKAINWDHIVVERIQMSECVY